MNNNNRLFCALLYLSLHPLSALADDELIDKAFYPYRAAIPEADGLNTGMLIESDNVERFKELLDPAMLGFIRQGWTRIEVAPTTSFDLHPHYVEATRKHLNSAKLGANPVRSAAPLPDGPFPRSRMPPIRAPGRNSPGTSSTATTGATARSSPRSSGSTATWTRPRWSAPST